MWIIKRYDPIMAHTDVVLIAKSDKTAAHIVEWFNKATHFAAKYKAPQNVLIGDKLFVIQRGFTFSSEFVEAVE